MHPSLPGSPQQLLLSSPGITPSKAKSQTRILFPPTLGGSTLPRCGRSASSSTHPSGEKTPQRPRTARLNAKGVASLSLNALTVGGGQKKGIGRDKVRIPAKDARGGAP
jgi:hypothetical protein